MNITNITVHKHKDHRVKIEQTQLKRDWMDETDNKHAYKCFPVSLVNTFGWSISFLDDIELIWDGVSDTTPDHVKILSAGDNVCSTSRGNATVSFYTGLFFRTEENVSILSIVPPNYFIDGATPFTSVISTSFYDDAYPVAWRITRPNHAIRIPAGTPVATLIPISIGDLSHIELDIYNKEFDPRVSDEKIASLAEWNRLSQEGKFTNFYRDAVNYKGESIGKHEQKNLILKTNDYTEKTEA